jgi:hypothetical protein
MINQTLAAATNNLLANQRPLLFLDTCDLVNLLQILTTVPVPELRAVNRLLAALAANPQRCQPVGADARQMRRADAKDMHNNRRIGARPLG